MAGIQINGANQKLVLDSDADTYLEAGTDDTIKFYVAGAHDLTLSDNALNVLSGTTLTIDSGATIANSGTATGFGAVTALNNATQSELVTVGSTTTELDAEANLTFTGSALTCIGTVTVGVDNTGHDVKYFGATSGSYWLWDEDADGVVQIGTLTVGVNDAGHDVKFFGDTASAYMLWDTSTDDLILAGAAKLYLYDAAGGEHISSDGTDLTIASGNLLNLTATTDIVIPTNVGLHFTDSAEKIESDGTDFTFNSGNDINLTATTDINIPSDVGLTFGNDGEKIEGDGSDLTISGNTVNLDSSMNHTFSSTGKAMVLGF